MARALRERRRRAGRVAARPRPAVGDLARGERRPSGRGASTRRRGSARDSGRGSGAGSAGGSGRRSRARSRSGSACRVRTRRSSAPLPPRLALVKAYRTHGHLAARLDPLGSEPVGDPALEPERLVPKLTPELQAQIPASVLRVGVEGETLADVLPKLEETYCGTIAYEIEHISDHQERVWLRQAIETGRYREPLTTDERRRLLEQLTQVEVFEHYLLRAFLGQKQFSIEGPRRARADARRGCRARPPKRARTRS